MNHYGRIVLLVLAAWMPCSALSAFAQSSAQSSAQPQPSTRTPMTAPAIDTRPASQTKTPTTSQHKPSLAERIVRLEQMIETGQKELAGLQTELADPNSEYVKAKEEFTRLDKRLKEREKEAASQPAPAAGEDPLEGLRKARELAKERFELAIKDANATREKAVALENKLKLDQDALNKLRGTTASQPAGLASPPTAPAAPSVNVPVQTEPAAPSIPPAQTAEKLENNENVTEPDPAPAPAETATAPTLPVIGPAAILQPRPSTAAPSTASPSAPVPPATPDPQNKELIEAHAKAQNTKIQATTTEEELRLIDARMEAVRQAIRTETELRDTARERAANANATYATRRQYIQKLISTGAPREELNKIWAMVGEAEKLAAEAEKEVNLRLTAIDELNVQLEDLRNEQDDIRKRYEQAQKAAIEAQSQVRRLENPFSIYNIKQWLLRHGPNILGILIGMVVLMWFTGMAESRIIKLIARSDGQGTQREREDRARTLASVFRNFGSTVIVCGGFLMLLSEIELNIVPLLGGAAVFGLAVAFGAQSLIKDYFYGFMILLENQYAINDVIKIGDVSGMVERITLRMTVLRSMDGSAHFIPHGEVHKVTNMSHRWSRAVFEIGISYREDVDQVMKVLVELGKEMRTEYPYSQQMLDGPEMLGVDAFSDSAIVIKFFIKTIPLQQWSIKREMLRRIKKRFDELGIEIPFPHRVVYHRSEDISAPPENSGLTNIR